MCRAIKFKEVGKMGNYMEMLKYNIIQGSILKGNIRMELEFKVLFVLMIKHNIKEAF
jgi:hypothetical protein